MKFLLLVVACLIAACVAAPLSQDSYQFLFTKFVEQYNKQYEMNDVFNRFNTFKSNLDLIVAHNARPEETFKMGVNQFTDLTSVEFSKMMGLKTISTKSVQVEEVPACQVPKTELIDWRDKKVINPVKNQASCGSCWAFSAMCPIEAMAALKTGTLYNLAEQQFVDCVSSSFDPSFISEGCNGGLMTEAMGYAAVTGVCQTTDYPYTARDGKCVDSCKKAVQPKGFIAIKPSTGDANYLTNIKNGPISVGLAASSSAFQFYKSGIVSTCNDRSLNHGVVLVGIGSEAGQDYYIIRNSWGESWGNGGYIHLSTRGNQCGLGTSPWDGQPTF